MRDYVKVSAKQKQDEDGEPYVHLQIRNDLVGWYDLPEALQSDLDKLAGKFGGYFEPYDSMTWDAYLWGLELKDAEKPNVEDGDDSMSLIELVEECNKGLAEDGFDHAGFKVSHVKEGDEDFIVFSAPKEYQGSDEESDSATNIDACIKEKFPEAELVSWNEPEGGCKWKLGGAA